MEKHHDEQPDILELKTIHENFLKRVKRIGTIRQKVDDLIRDYTPLVSLTTFSAVIALFLLYNREEEQEKEKGKEIPRVLLLDETVSEQEVSLMRDIHGVLNDKIPDDDTRLNFLKKYLTEIAGSCKTVKEVEDMVDSLLAIETLGNK